MEEQIEKFNLKEHLTEDFSCTEWGKLLINNVKEEITASINKLKNISLKLKNESELSKFYLCILDDIDKLQEILNENTWDGMYAKLSVLKFKTWPTDKKTVMELKDKAKEIRDGIKKEINKFKEKIFIYNSKQANEDIYAMYEILTGIKNVILTFMDEYQKAKKERNIIDFSDIEHYALNILVTNSNRRIPR